MKDGLYILNYVRFNKQGLLHNGKQLWLPPTAGLKEYLVEHYNELNLQYPKFFKMDTLSQLAFLGTSLLLQGGHLESYPKEDVGIVLSNSASSLDTDRRYQQTIQSAHNYFPSPAVFVYTLPSIMSGEIAIATGFTGENNFFITDHFDADLLHQYVTDLFATGQANACISGWVELDGEEFDVLLWTVGKVYGTEAHLPFSASQLAELYG